MRLEKVNIERFLDTLDIKGHDAKIQSIMAKSVADWVNQHTDGKAEVKVEKSPKDPPPRTFGMIIARTNFYLNWDEIRANQLLVVLNMIVSNFSGEDLIYMGISTLVLELEAAWGKVGHLDEDEAEAARRLARLLRDRQLHNGRRCVSTEEYLKCWPAHEGEKAKWLLLRLEDRGVIKQHSSPELWTFAR